MGSQPGRAVLAMALPRLIRTLDAMPLDLDAVTLSRIQFAFTIAFHIILSAWRAGWRCWICAG
jgi:hypothetical protein